MTETPTRATGPAGRVRDPERRECILAAAAELVAQHGYHSVRLAEIGAAAGIVGSGVYRHFDSKIAVLVALLDRVLDRLLSHSAEIVVGAADERAALGALVRDQITFAIDERRLVQVYHRELHNLPVDDRRRLRRMQRHYIEEWVHVLTGLRPELSDFEARTLVHAAIGAIQSVTYYHSGLSRGRRAAVLADVAHAALGVPAAGDDRTAATPVAEAPRG